MGSIRKRTLSKEYRVPKPANPYRTGSMSARVFGALVSSSTSLTASVIARRTRMPVSKVEQVLAALRNPLHNSVGRRAGVSVVRKGEGYMARRTKAEPNAKRKAKKKRAKSR